MADAQGTVMRWPLMTPRIEELLRRKLEAQGTIGVPNLEPFSGHRLTFRRHELEAAIPGLRHAQNRNRTCPDTRLHAHSVAAFSVIEAQTSENRPPFSDAQMERPVVSH